MADASGIAVDTFSMTKGLFDAYSKARTERQARDKTQAEMERASFQFDAQKQLADKFDNGQISPQQATAGFIRSGNPAQAMDAFKTQPLQWQKFGQGPGPAQGQPPMMAQGGGQPPVAQPGGAQGPTPQYEMQQGYQTQQPGAPPALPTQSPAGGIFNQWRAYGKDLTERNNAQMRQNPTFAGR